MQGIPAAERAPGGLKRGAPRARGPAGGGGVGAGDAVVEGARGVKRRVAARRDVAAVGRAPGERAPRRGDLGPMAPPGPPPPRVCISRSCASSLRFSLLFCSYLLCSSLLSISRLCTRSCAGAARRGGKHSCVRCRRAGGGKKAGDGPGLFVARRAHPEVLLLLLRLLVRGVHLL